MSRRARWVTGLRIGPRTRLSVRGRLVLAAIAVGIGAALTGLTSLDHQTGRPIRVVRWDPATRTVRESTCIPDDEFGAAKPYSGTGRPPNPHSCSQAS